MNKSQVWSAKKYIGIWPHLTPLGYLSSSGEEKEEEEPRVAKEGFKACRSVWWGAGCGCVLRECRWEEGRPWALSRKRLGEANLMDTHSQVLLPKTQLPPHNSSAFTASPPTQNQLYIQTGNQSSWWMSMLQRVSSSAPSRFWEASGWEIFLGTGIRVVLLCPETPTSSLGLNTSHAGLWNGAFLHVVTTSN